MRACKQIECGDAHAVIEGAVREALVHTPSPPAHILETSHLFQTWNLEALQGLQAGIGV